ncbi:unnamed protein product [Penicillium salamii]|nr:unnamed protein product [Penicillium salamii]CAG8275610.1 unnamed protein product [Penicillium salamii]CAG8363908.1 unnamed protein product [Penicillium salamii]
MSLEHQNEKGGEVETQQVAAFDERIIKDSGTTFTAAEGFNSTAVTYQDAAGAPVETNSPLGYSVSFWTSLCLNINQMIGTGIFSTRRSYLLHVAQVLTTWKAASILDGVGSVGLTMVYWFIGYLLSESTLALYLEFASYFPSRSGAEVVYLEQAFPYPKYFFPTIFAAKHVIFSFGSSNAVVLAEYIFGIGGLSYTNWQLKGVAVTAYTVAFIVLTLLLISIAGLIVLGGHTKVEDPKVNWRNPWEGTSNASAYGATNAMVKLIFSYAGYTNAFSVVNEIKNPVKTLRWSAPLSLIGVTVLYILVNVAYFSAASREEILASKQIAAAIFFEKVFGSNQVARGLNVLICAAAFGNLMVVMINYSRMLRETGRQGILPYPKFWTSTKPFGTPLGPYIVQWVITVIMIIAPPAGDAFNFIVDLAVYPGNIFNFLLVIGLLLIRRQRARMGLPRPEYRAWNIAIAFALITNVYMLIAPWYPPTSGANGGDVSFWYGTYLVVSIGLLVLCGIYYYLWIGLLPRWKGYEHRQTLVELDDGSITHQLVKVSKEDLTRWDDEHDATGRVYRRTGYSSADQGSNSN